MSKLDELRNHRELREVVSVLVKQWPSVDISTDSEYYPWRDGTVVVYVNYVDEIKAKAIIRETIEVKHTKLIFRFNTNEHGSLRLNSILPTEG